MSSGTGAFIQFGLPGIAIALFALFRKQTGAHPSIPRKNQRAANLDNLGPAGGYSNSGIKMSKYWGIRRIKGCGIQNPGGKTRLMMQKKGSGTVLLVFLMIATWLYSGESDSYVGWNQCSACHSDIADTWKNTRHAKAIESLKKTEQENLPACVKCHVTGYEKDGGFIDYELTPEMAGVQCEVCHGPGSDHSGNPTKDNTIKKPGAELCRECHTEGQDPGFAYDVKIKDVHGK